jgi:hypothetical protein
VDMGYCPAVADRAKKAPLLAEAGL